jgi:uncharacterized protein Yka (UPF0111/DUF47 family)
MKTLKLGLYHPGNRDAFLDLTCECDTTHDAMEMVASILEEYNDVTINNCSLSCTIMDSPKE